MMLRTLFVAAEYAGLVKVGGLADVSAALPRALCALGHDVRVLLPGYGCLNVDIDRMPVVAALPGRERRIRMFEREGNEPRVLVLDTPAFRRRMHPYHDQDGTAWHDDSDAFADLARVAAAVADNRVGLDWRADVVHANEWHAGLVPVQLLLQHVPAASVFTVHNLAYQGVFPLHVARDLGLPRWLLQPGTLEFHGGFSFMKGGLVFADKVTAVSPSYAREIRTLAFGEGLDGVLNERRDDLVGILNGIDMQDWNPQHDAALLHPFSDSDPSGKNAEKERLLQSLGLDACRDGELLCVFVGRLVSQKGVDLLLDALPRLMQMPLRIALLGKGDRPLEQALRAAEARHRGRLAVRVCYDEMLARRFYAAGDVLLMPSRFEPCGLAQLYAMRYGCLPLAHAVGGLRDSIVDADAPARANDTATGFLFEPATADGMIETVQRALALRADRDAWRRVMRAAMRRDSSWTSAAKRYVDVYQLALDKRRA